MPHTAAGFLVFFALERYTALYRGPPPRSAISHVQQLSVFSAASLCVHSFLDGATIGVSFQTARNWDC
jgi:zinc transporter ZupT